MIVLHVLWEIMIRIRDQEIDLKNLCQCIRIIAYGDELQAKCLGRRRRIENYF